MKDFQHRKPFLLIGNYMNIGNKEMIFGISGELVELIAADYYQTEMTDDLIDMIQQSIRHVLSSHLHYCVTKSIDLLRILEKNKDAKKRLPFFVVDLESSYPINNHSGKSQEFFKDKKAAQEYVELMMRHFGGGLRGDKWSIKKVSSEKMIGTI